jgi:hypothetical protein
VSRTIKLASPLMSGKDVEALQRAVNVRFKHHHIAKAIKVDGEYGPATRRAVRQVAYLLGLDVGLFDQHGATPRIVRKIKAPKKRNPRDRRRARAREPWVKRFRAAVAEAHRGPRMAIQYGRRFVGLVEHPAGSNHGKYIDDWEKACGFSGAPWCGMFANAMLRAGGFPNQPWLAYCPTIEARAKGGIDGWTWHPPGQGKVGDLVLYGTPIAHHTGIYLGKGVTLEGNTSFDDAGDQANGGAVAIRHRDLSGGGGFPLRGFARPPWNHHK